MSQVILNARVYVKQKINLTWPKLSVKDFSNGKTISEYIVTWGKLK